MHAPPRRIRAWKGGRRIGTAVPSTDRRPQVRRTLGYRLAVGGVQRGEIGGRSFLLPTPARRGGPTPAGREETTRRPQAQKCTQIGGCEPRGCVTAVLH